MILSRFAMVVAVAVALQVTAPSTGAQGVDFEFFKTRVEPIFLKKRGHLVRCYVCHAESRTAFRLEKLAPGSTFWTEEQSHRNFEVVSQLVAPGDPTSSRLLMHPLAPTAGGDPVHNGGRQFKSQKDPDWLILAEWVATGPPWRPPRDWLLPPGPNLLLIFRFTGPASRPSF